MAHINFHSLATQHGGLATHQGVALRSLVTHRGIAPNGPLIPPFPGFNNFSLVAQLRFGQSYAATHGGLLPSNPFWEYMIYRHDINPRMFNLRHRPFAALLDHNQAVTLANQLVSPTVGVVPNTPYWNYLRYRHDSMPVIFDAHHPALARLLDLDQAVRQQTPVPIIPPPPAAEQVTPPSSGPIITTTVPTGTFTPGAPAPVPGGETNPPVGPSELVPAPSSVIPLASGLLLIFFVRKWGRIWMRLTRREPSPA